MKQMLLENKKLIIIIIIVLLLSISGLTLAYFVGQIGPAATTNVNLTTKTVDNLTFTTGNDITIGPVNQANFAQGSGNKSGSTTASATLKANTGNNSATNTYNVYLKINTNTFEYTTSNNTAELVLKVTNPSGNTQTISGLTQVTSGGITGYDITNKVSIIPIATDYTITTTSTKTDTWTAQVYFVNLNSDQEANTSKTFNAELVIEKREPVTVTFDANGGSVSQTSKEVTYGTYYEDLPTPTKSGATFLGWNGKNMILDFINGKGIRTTDGTIYNTAYSVVTNFIEVDFSTKTYYLSYLMSNLYCAIYAYNEDYEFVSRTSGSIRNRIMLDNNSFMNSTSVSNDPIKYIRVTQYVVSGQTRDNIDGLDFSVIQLEEGTTATLYEPYYVTSDVAVTQESDHTLTAVWQEN